MAWFEELIPASFREIPFYLDSTTLDFGQRVQVNEYPFSNIPNTRNLGRKARKYTFNAYVIGSDYIAARNALLNAVEDKNTPGLLTHPTLGIKMVYAGDCTVTYSNKEGGWEIFRLEFVEAGQNIFPSLGNNTQLQSAIAAAEATEAIYDDFKNKFVTKDSPDFIADAAKGNVQDYIGMIGDAAQTGVSSQTSYATFSDNLNTFASKLDTNITDASALGGGIKDLSTGLSNLYDAPDDAYNASFKMLDYGANYYPPAGNTPTTQQQLTNQYALINIVQNIAIAQLITAAASMTFDSRQDAILIRDQVSSFIKDQLFFLSEQQNTTQYNILADLLAKFVSDITARSATLKNIVFVKTADSIPAVLFAEDQYGSATFESEVINRNNIRHPLFMTPYTEYEVLK